MTTTTFRAGYDAHIFEGKPGRAFGGPAQLAIDSGAAIPLLAFPLGNRIPANAVVSAARLRVYQVDAWAGSTTLTLRRVALWKSGKVTWTDQPSLLGTAVAVTQSDTANGALWEFVTTADAVAWLAGAANYGWRITSSSTTRRHIKGFDANRLKPEWEIDWTVPPDAPTDLVPSFGAVSVTKPVIGFTADRDMSSLQIQIAADADFDTPDFDSGQVATTEGKFDLAASAYAGNTTTTSYRVKQWNASGESAWSQVAEWTYTAHPAVTITNPGATTSDPTPPVTWTSTGQTQRQVVYKNAAGKVVDDSGWATTAGLSYTPAKGPTANGQVCTVEVRTRDGVIREATDGTFDYATDTQSFTLTFTDTVDPILWLDVSQSDVAPWVTCRFDATDLPDGWVILRDGEIIAVTETGTELASGAEYRYVDMTAPPNRECEYDVRRVVNDETADTGLPQLVTPTIKGVWLGDPLTEQDVLVLGRDEVDATYGETGDTYYPLDGGPAINSISALRGLEGTVTGYVADIFGRTATDDIDALYAMKTGGGTYRLAYADVNIPVALRGVNPTPRRLMTSPGKVSRNVSFSFTQDGELPFDWES